MRSMTGYGRGQSVHDGAKFSVELNSVNRKQSDVVVSLPPGVAPAGVRIVARAEALRLVDYLLSLDHTYPVSRAALNGAAR